MGYIYGMFFLNVIVFIIIVCAYDLLVNMNFLFYVDLLLYPARARYGGNKTRRL